VFVLGAKLAVAALAGVVLAVVCVGIAFSAGIAILAGRDVHVALTGTHSLPLVFGTIAASALGAILGVAVGTLIRNQAGDRRGRRVRLPCRRGALRGRYVLPALVILGAVFAL
jgi:uncharacterized protein YcfJ